MKDIMYIYACKELKLVGLDSFRLHHLERAIVSYNLAF